MRYYRLQRSSGKVMFSQASLILTTGGGVHPSMHWGRHPLPLCMLGYTAPQPYTPWADTPQANIPPGRLPPGQTPPGQKPPWADTPSWQTLLSGRHPLVHPPMPTAVDGMHPTGMHSCLEIGYANPTGVQHHQSQKAKVSCYIANKLPR